ncbi:MAG: hypothetical protein ACI8PZ_003450 [Myxococcota bacterium]|jgi:hypothetical protein
MEQWESGERVVQVEGGSRRPAVHPDLAAWHTVRGALAGDTGAVVAECPACAQPMVADEGGQWLDWPLQTPDGAVMIRAGTLPANHSIAALDSALDAAWAERFDLRAVRPGRALFQGGLLTLILVPIALWVIAVGVVSLFLFSAVTDPEGTIPGMGQGVTLP